MSGGGGSGGAEDRGECATQEFVGIGVIEGAEHGIRRSGRKGNEGAGEEDTVAVADFAAGAAGKQLEVLRPPHSPHVGQVEFELPLAACLGALKSARGKRCPLDHPVPCFRHNGYTCVGRISTYPLSCDWDWRIILIVMISVAATTATVDDLQYHSNPLLRPLLLQPQPSLRALVGSPIHAVIGCAGL